MKLDKCFNENELDQAKKIIQEFYDGLLLDSSVSNPIAVSLSIYMASNENKTSFVEKDVSKGIFKSFGRKPEDFDKVLYEISGKRKGKIKLVDTDGEKVGLNFNGLKKVKELLEGNKNGS